MFYSQESSMQLLSRKFIIKLQSVYHTLKTAEKKAADYILKEPELFAVKSVVETSDIAGCSEATLVRLARKLGYSGYPELKASVLLKMGESSQSLYGDISAEDDEIQIAKKVYTTCIQTLTDTLNLLNPATYHLAIEAMLTAKRFLFVGAGDAYTAAYTAYLKFMRIGLDCTCPNDFDIQLIEASKLKPNDILIIISHSGRTISVFDVLKCAKTSGAKVISITNYPLSPIAKLSDIILQTAAFTPDSVGEVTSKRMPELAMIESLYINLVTRLDRQHLDVFRNSNDAVLVNKI